jgi:hypothetical protein
MSEAGSEALTISPEQAIREVLRIEQRTGALTQRTIGITWMLWAFVNAGIFLSYEAIGIAQPPGQLLVIGFLVAWVPWVILGTVATSVLWRSVLELHLPSNPGGSQWVTGKAAAVFLALVLGGLVFITIANAPSLEPVWAMFAVGVAAAVVGGSGLTTRDRTERTMWLMGGTLLAVLAIGIDLVAVRAGIDPLDFFLVFGPLASTSVLFGGGLYTASR